MLAGHEALRELQDALRVHGRRSAWAFMSWSCAQRRAPRCWPSQNSGDADAGSDAAVLSDDGQSVGAASAATTSRGCDARQLSWVDYAASDERTRSRRVLAVRRATAGTRSTRAPSCSPAASTATSAAPDRGSRTTSTWSRTSTSGPSLPAVAASPGRPASTPTATCPARSAPVPRGVRVRRRAAGVASSSTGSTGARPASCATTASRGSPGRASGHWSRWRPTSGRACAARCSRQPRRRRRRAVDHGPGVVVFDEHGRAGVHLAAPPNAGSARWSKTRRRPRPIESKPCRRSPPGPAPSRPGTDPLELAARARVRTRSGAWLLLYGTRLSGEPTAGPP